MENGAPKNLNVVPEWYNRSVLPGDHKFNSNSHLWPGGKIARKRGIYFNRNFVQNIFDNNLKFQPFQMKLKKQSDTEIQISKIQISKMQLFCKLSQ